MKNPIRQLCFVAAAALAMAMASGLPAHAQAWPTQPVKYVVPFSPGGGSGIVGTQAVARSPADGYP